MHCSNFQQQPRKSGCSSIAATSSNIQKNLVVAPLSAFRDSLSRLAESHLPFGCRSFFLSSELQPLSVVGLFVRLSRCVLVMRIFGWAWYGEFRSRWRGEPGKSYCSSIAAISSNSQSLVAKRLPATAKVWSSQQTSSNSLSLVVAADFQQLPKSGHQATSSNSLCLVAKQLPATAKVWSPSDFQQLPKSGRHASSSNCQRSSSNSHKSGCRSDFQQHAKSGRRSNVHNVTECCEGWDQPGF